jgi:hypothetical protein
MKLEAETRRRWLLRLGATITAGFILLRATNLYGDPVPWTIQESWPATALSFLNCEKYPPSLLYLIMTLGPALLLLAAFETCAGGWPDGSSPSDGCRSSIMSRTSTLSRTGRRFCPAMTPDHSWLSDGLARNKFAVLSLGGVYLVWLCVVALMYPLCRWFAELQRRTEWWWSYL